MTDRISIVALGLVLARCAPAPVAVAPDASDDKPFVLDVPRGPMRRTFTAEGCTHVVRTAPGTTELTRGDRETFGADATPRNVHVSWPSDPRSVIAMLWKTDRATLATVVEYGTARDRLDRTAVGYTFTARNLFGELSQHETHVCGLTPDTTYYYRVGGPGHWSEVQHFKTAPARPDVDVNFAVTGDSRDDVRVWRMVQERIAAAPASMQPDFQVFTGDAVPFGAAQERWDAWFEQGAATFARMPFVLAHGNHEGLSLGYLMQFAQPQTGEVAQDELYYSFDYGPVHFVVLNDTPYLADYVRGFSDVQAHWLRDDLRAHRARRAEVPWIIAVHHKAPFSGSLHVDDSDVAIVRSVLPPIYSEFGVDVVLNGHDHQYEITQPLDARGQPVPPGARGVVYITTGGAGANLYAAGDRAWRRYSERTYNFVLATATPRTLTLTPFRGDGTVISEGRLSLVQRP